MNDNMEDLLNEIRSRRADLEKMVYVEEGHVVINVHYEYNIACDRCDTPEKILAWCVHLCEKTWMTPEVIRRFVQVAYNANGLGTAPTP